VWQLQALQRDLQEAQARAISLAAEVEQASQRVCRTLAGVPRKRADSPRQAVRAELQQQSASASAALSEKRVAELSRELSEAVRPSARAVR
jgi:hypothetical protein